MSNFWAAKLAGQAPPPLTTQTEAWWSSNPLSAEPKPATVHIPGYEPVTVPPPARARESQRNSSRCPECDSSNYMRASASAAYRCFDCGFPLVQSTSGASISSDTPSGRPVRQALNNGFHPGKIIGRIS